MIVKNCMKPSDLRESLEVLIKRVGLLVQSKLQLFLSKDSTTLHFDGELTCEEAKVHHGSFNSS